MNRPIVVFDACLLMFRPICHTLLKAAELDLYIFYTSPKILEETTRNLTKILINRNKLDPDFDLNTARQEAEKKSNAIRNAFPEALVEPSESLISSLDNDPKDRHVLAAAIEAQKTESNTSVIIVTDNLRDFPSPILSKYNVQAISPDNFFLKLIEIQDSTEYLFKLLIKQAEERHNGEILKLLQRLENAKVRKFVQVILTEYFLEEIYEDVCFIIKKNGKTIEEKKYLKISCYEIYLNGENITIKSLSKSCSIELDCSEILINDICVEDVQTLKRLI